MAGAGRAPRILIVRMSALGDIVFCTALLDALRRRWPDATIGWLLGQRFAGLLRDDPRLDARIVVDDRALGRIGTWTSLRTALAPHRFDWVIDAQGLLKSRLLSRLVPGATRIGFASKEPAGWLLDTLLPKGGDIADFASEYRALAAQLTGLEAPVGRLHVDPDLRAAVAARLGGEGLAEGYLALCPYTTRPQKHWFDDHWGELAQRLSAAGAPPVAVLGGPAERDAAQALVARMPPGSINLAGRTALHELPATLSLAGAVVGVDTGLTHIGIAVRRPTLALFGSTVPYRRAADDAPFELLYDDLPCSPCKRHPTCDGAFTCMRELTAARAEAATLRLLQD